MHFLDPSLFWPWAALAVVPVVLYLFRPRPRTVPTTTLPFFQLMAREYQDSAWRRWLKHLISLLLTILLIVAAASALARLIFAPTAAAWKTVVVLVDRSASMAAAPPQGLTRLEEAVALARRRLAELSPDTGVIVMAYDRRPEVLLSRTTDARQIDRTLGGICTRAMEAEPEAALRLAFALAAVETPAVVWRLTDAAAPAEKADLPHASPGDPPPDRWAVDEPLPTAPQGVAVEHLSVALPQAVNVGITGFALHRMPLDPSHFEAFVQVHSAAATPAPAELEVRLDAKLVAVRKLEIAARGHEQLLIPIEGDAAADRVLSLKVSSSGDMLPADDTLLARVPRLRSINVLWISPDPDPFMELALSTLAAEGELEVSHGKPQAWPPKENPDVVIFDGWLPEKWPDGVAVVIINPPGAAGPVRAARLAGQGLPLESVRTPDRGHALLYGVATGRLALVQTAVVESSGPLDPVLTGSQGPVLLAGQWQGQRVVVLAFSPQRSERLPLMASYPLLVGNILYWAAEGPMEASHGMNRRTGDLVALRGKTIHWREPGDLAQVRTAEPPAGAWVELDRVGLWETDASEAGSAALLSSRATLLPASDTAGETPAPGASTWGGELTPALLSVMLLLMLLESWLFHRSLAY